MTSPTGDPKGEGGTRAGDGQQAGATNEPTVGSTTERHWFGPGKGSGGRESKGTGHPIMYGKPQPTRHFDAMPDGGGYPHGFVEWALAELGATDPAKVLHLCSGSMRTGVRVDIRPEMQPDIVADCRNVPLPDESFDHVLIDPPYSEDYARDLYGTGAHYPRPGQILREACRLLRPGGRVGFLHFQVPMSRKPLRLVGVYGITTGAGFNIRAWSVFEKVPQQQEMVA